MRVLISSRHPPHRRKLESSHLGSRSRPWVGGGRCTWESLCSFPWSAHPRAQSAPLCAGPFLGGAYTGMNPTFSCPRPRPRGVFHQPTLCSSSLIPSTKIQYHTPRPPDLPPWDSGQQSGQPRSGILLKKNNHRRRHHRIPPMQ